MIIETESLQLQIEDLRRAVEVSGIQSTSLMGKMLDSSLKALDLAQQKEDWATVERGLKNTQGLLSQCTL